MIETKHIKAGTVVDIIAAGTSGRYKIVDVHDGRVTLMASDGKRTRQNAKSRWWLDFDYVKEHGRRVVVAVGRGRSADSAP